MKISIHIEPQLGYAYSDIVTLAKAAEDSGFYGFTVSDHRSIDQPYVRRVTQ